MAQRIKPQLDLINAALKKRGVTLKRTDLLEFAAEAFNFHNSHELTAAVQRGAIEIPLPSSSLSTTRENEIVSFFKQTPGAQELQYLTDLYGEIITKPSDDEIISRAYQVEPENGVDCRWLTNKELAYLGYDFIVSPNIHGVTHLGYSVLYKDRKYYAPTMEIEFEGGASLHAAEASENIAKIIHKNLKLYKIDGHVFIDHNTGPEGMRHEVVTLIPMKVAQRTKSFNEWKLWLTLSLFAPLY